MAVKTYLPKTEREMRARQIARVVAEGKRFAEDTRKFNEEWELEIGTQLVRSGKIGGKKKYFKTPEGKIISKVVEPWAKVKRLGRDKETQLIPKLVPQCGDEEDNGRTPEDMEAAIAHYETRYDRGLDIHTGEPLEGDALKFWQARKNENRIYTEPKAKQGERNRSVMNSMLTDNYKFFAEACKYIGKLKPEGVELYGKLVAQANIDEKAPFVSKL